MQRLSLILAGVLLCITAWSQSEIVSLQVDHPILVQKEHHLDKAINAGWTELSGQRKPHALFFEGPGNQRIAFSSKEVLCYEHEGQLKVLDYRPERTLDGWKADQQPYPVRLDEDGSFDIALPSGSIRFSGQSQFNGQRTQAPSHSKQQGRQVIFDEVLPGIDKVMEFRSGAIKLNYVLEEAPLIDEELRITELFELPSDVRAAIVQGKNASPGLSIEFRNTSGQLVGGVKELLCVDASGRMHVGSYELNTEGELVMIVDGEWLLAEERTYPVVIDPLVTGPVSNYPGTGFGSCFLPEYDSDSLLVEVPGGISVLDLIVETNYYASPFTTTVMGDGRMYFSSECGETTVFQVQGENGMLPGTAYLENFDMNTPIMCCYPQQCDPYSFWLSQHLSRTSNGPGCNSSYLYYDPFSQWTFSAYVIGCTAELYAQEMDFTPNDVCSNVCEVDARIFAHYGVPPYTFTHPWSDDVLEWGEATGCGIGNCNRVLLLNLPDCPDYCLPYDSLSVPIPIVTDACGAVATVSVEEFKLPIRPTPLLEPVTDLITVCSDEPFTASWTSCFEEASVSWEGNGTSGEGYQAEGLINNSGTEASMHVFTAVPGLDGCIGLPSEVNVEVLPFASTSFTWEPNVAIILQDIQLENQTAYNGNVPTGWNWTYGADGLADEQDPVISFMAPGEYEVCLWPLVEEGCSQQHCEWITIIPAELVLPNIITPNGDEVNDVLHIQYLEFFDQNLTRVFNRWGNLVFEKENYANDWKADGVADGVYYYTVEIGDGKEYTQVLQIVR